MDKEQDITIELNAVICKCGIGHYKTCNVCGQDLIKKAKINSFLIGAILSALYWFVFIVRLL